MRYKTVIDFRVEFESDNYAPITRVASILQRVLGDECKLQYKLESIVFKSITMKSLSIEDKSKKCTCPPTDALHTPPCIYYAPSPQDIYKETL